MQQDRRRIAFVVSHPIQYYVPLYRRLARRQDVDIKVFYTWHAADAPTLDPGFQRTFTWDIPLTEGYEYELLTNRSRNPGTHHFFGLQNPDLISRVIDWKPDVVHTTGYAFASHLRAIRAFSARGIPVLFRGDSHLLDESEGLKSLAKRFVLKRIYSHVHACLYVGKHNYDYFRRAGVPRSRLFYCPHSIDVQRFSEPDDQFEQQASQWRHELQISPTAKVLLFAGKFEARKRPIELMQTICRMATQNLVAVMVGNGELENQVRDIAANNPATFRVISFQNQSNMPVVYRMADVFALPSSHGETWGLAVNEALASGTRVIISDKVGCAPEAVISEADGAVFAWDDWSDFESKLHRLLRTPENPVAVRQRSRRFDTAVAETTLLEALQQVVRRNDV